MKNFVKITIPVIIIMLVAIELILRLAPVPNPHEYDRSLSRQLYIPSQFKPHQTKQVASNEGLPFVDSIARASFNNYGFRGPNIDLNKPKEGYRIFMIGGSTTECILIDEKKAPHTLLQKKLSIHKIEAFNAGKSGDITTDHVAMLSHRIIHLKPDLIILFCGVNDLFKSAIHDYTHAYNVTKNGGTKNHIKALLANLQIYRRMFYLFKTGSIQNTTESNYKAGIKYRNGLPQGNFQQLKFNYTAYEKNLRAFAGICQANHVQLILVTQATTWASKVEPQMAKRHWMSFIAGKKYHEKQMNQVMEQYNDVMRKVAKDLKVHLYDLAQDIPKSSQYFYDDCHFNNNGARFFADKIGAHIKKIGGIPPLDVDQK